MPIWLIRPALWLMFKCAWLVGLNYGANIISKDGVLAGVVLATSLEAYTAAFSEQQAVAKDSAAKSRSAAGSSPRGNKKTTQGHRTMHGDRE